MTFHHWGLRREIAGLLGHLIQFQQESRAMRSQHQEV